MAVLSTVKLVVDMMACQNQGRLRLICQDFVLNMQEDIRNIVFIEKANRNVAGWTNAKFFVCNYKSEYHDFTIIMQFIDSKYKLGKKISAKFK